MQGRQGGSLVHPIELTNNSFMVGGLNSVVSVVLKAKHMHEAT